MSGERIDLDPIYQPSQAAFHVVIELIRAGKISIPTNGEPASKAIKNFDLLHEHFKTLKKS